MPEINDSKISSFEKIFDKLGQIVFKFNLIFQKLCDFFATRFTKVFFNDYFLFLLHYYICVLFAVKTCSLRFFLIQIIVLTDKL